MTKKGTVPLPQSSEDSSIPPPKSGIVAYPPVIQDAFNYAGQSIKQLLTLSSAGLASAIPTAAVLSGDSGAFEINPLEGALLMASWISYLLSITLGVVGLRRLSLKLDQLRSSHSTRLSATIFFGTLFYIQFILFLFGVALFTSYAAVAMFGLELPVIVQADP